MKKIISFVLLSFILLSQIGAAPRPLEKEEKVDQIVNTIQKYIKQEGFSTFQHDLKGDSFSAKFSLENILSECYTDIYVQDDMVIARAEPVNFTIKNENLEKVAIYIALVNYKLRYTSFFMDFESKTVFTYSFQYVEETLPGTAEIDILLYSTLWGLEDYGNGLYKVAKNGVDPYEAFQEAYEALTAQG